MRIMKKIPFLLSVLVVVMCLIACSKVPKEDRQTEISRELQTQDNVQIPESQRTETEEEKETENEPETEGIAVFNLENGTVRLNSGYEMPVTGLGTYALSHDECVASVTALFENGGRLIDTASFYGTEKSVGEAVRNSHVSREEIFVTTKLYPNQFSDAEAANVVKYIQSLGIVVQGWYPLGGRGYTEKLLNHKTLCKIAAEHGKSSAQVILRWNLQKGVVVIPGSRNERHIR